MKLKKFDKYKLNNICFIIFLLFFSCGVLIKLILNNNDYNYTDNRMSYKFQIPNFKDFISGKYQESVENAISDQMPKYNWLKLSYSKLSNFLNIETIYLFKLQNQPRYIKLGGVNLYKGYLLYGTTTDYNFEITSKDDIANINRIVENVDANVYLYFIETDSNFNFETNYKVDSMSYLKNNLNISDENIASFNISSFDDYKGNFYKTDHHWNHKGSYKGYTEIAKLMHFNSILKPIDEVCFKGIKSGGSKTRSIGDKRYFKDIMCVYKFDFPEFYIKGSGEEIEDYGNSISKLKSKKIITYGTIYGGDYDELIFLNKESINNKKLLVYGNSYTNAINKLLASNYKETFVIDGRHFKDFDMIKYVNENKIDDILIIGNSILFWDDIKW